MKKIFKVFIAMLVCCACFLTACASGLENNPGTNETVIGNGGIATIKGEYLYFVNGYQDYTLYTDINKDNKFGSVERSGIYRTKLVDGEVVRDENGFLVDVDCVVPQCVGFKNGSFYIIGDYIYYLTPHMGNSYVDNEKQLMSSWVDVCKIKIDGTDKKDLFYTSNDATSLKWSVYTIANKTYIVLLDNTDLISYEVESGNKVTMASNVTSVALLEQENHTYGITNLIDVEQYVYYTRDYTQEEGSLAGNKLCKVKIGTSQEELVYTDVYNVTIKDMVNGCVYYTKVKDDGNSWNEELYKRNITTNVEVKVSGAYSSYNVVKYEEGEYVITTDSNNYMYLVKGDTQKLIYKSSAAVTVIGLDDNKVYFVENSQIYSVNYLADGEQEAVLVTDNEKTYMLDNAKLIDLDGRRIFVLTSYTASNSQTYYYLNVIDRYDTDAESDFVGKFVENELPAEPGEYENEDGEKVKDLWVK